MFVKFAAVALFAPAITSLGMNYSDINNWGQFLYVIQNIVLNPFLLASTIIGVWLFFKDGHPDLIEEEQTE